MLICSILQSDTFRNRPSPTLFKSSHTPFRPKLIKSRKITSSRTHRPSTSDGTLRVHP
jgi:hypothetical protein